MTLADAQIRTIAQHAVADLLRMLDRAEIPFERTPGDGVALWIYGASPEPGLSPAEHPSVRVIVAISEQQELLDTLVDSIRKV